MPIEEVETPKTSEEEEQANKPLLNIQLPAPLSGDPNSPLTVGRHNAAAQHNFQQIANILLTIINNQKVMGMLIKQVSDGQESTNQSVKNVADTLKIFLEGTEKDLSIILENKRKLNESKESENDESKSTDTAK